MTTAKTRSPGRQIELVTALPAAFVRLRWGCSERHARRLISKAQASPPPWAIVQSMLRAVQMGASGKYDPADILRAFEEEIQAQRKAVNTVAIEDDLALEEAGLSDLELEIDLSDYQLEPEL